MAFGSTRPEAAPEKFLRLPTSEIRPPVYYSEVSYRVFARKYRPQTFEEVVGQEHITRTLQNAISSGRVAQAYLFVGPRGIGKTSTARILAKALNCAEGPTAIPCGKCDACREIAEGRSLDVLEIDGASNNGVENIRELRDNAAYAPARGPYKIYLIDEVHMLSAGAFNALLKTLEEPPEHVKFIFATTEAQKVPATITSRCQRFDLRRIPAKAIAKHLLMIAEKENIFLEPEAAEAIARGAEGALRDAESMLDQSVAFCGEKISGQDVMTVFGFASREAIAALVEHILQRDAAGTLKIVAEQAEAGKDLSRLLGDLIGQVRDLLVAGVTDQPSVPRGKLLMLLDHFAETESRMRWAADKKLQLDVAVIKAAHLLDQASLDEVIETLAAFQCGAPLPPRPARPLQDKPPAVRAEDAPGPDLSKPPEPGSIDAAVAWNRVASSYESSIKFRWLTKAIFAEANHDGVIVQIPPSSAGELRSVVGEAGRKNAEAQLSEALGKKVNLRLEVGEHLAESPPAETSAQPAASPDEPRTSALDEEKPKDPVEEFKNDPLIKKALEIFAGEIQTAAK
jgi:DNA polymerase III subunit gamma/tau